MVLLKNDNRGSGGLPITSPRSKACVSEFKRERFLPFTPILMAMQVVGPFIDTPGLLFGDYAPDFSV
jgi:hypothetical protein